MKDVQNIDTMKTTNFFILKLVEGRNFDITSACTDSACAKEINQMSYAFKLKSLLRKIENTYFLHTYVHTL